MAYHIDAHHLPTLHHYKHALDEFNSIKPVRGEPQSMRRLGKRSDRNKWIRKEMIDGIEVYIAGLYETGLIYYYPTHMELTMGGWDTMSTREFIRKVAGKRLSSYDRSKHIPRGYMPPDEPRIDQFYNGYSIHANEKYKFTYEGFPMEPNRHPLPKKYSVNRKLLAEVRKPFKEFYTYLETMYKLHGEGVPENDGQLYRDVYIEVPSKDKWWSCYISIAHRIARYKWDTKGHVQYVKSYKDMIEYVEVDIRRNNPQVLTVVW